MKEHNCEKNILKFKLIFSDKNHSKLNTSPILNYEWKNLKNFKIMSKKSPSCYSLVIPRTCINLPKEICCQFVEFSITKLFNIQQLLHYMFKHYKIHLSTPLLIKGLCNSTKSLMLWEISMWQTNKRHNKVTFLNK
jgi:hypothetical protein